MQRYDEDFFNWWAQITFCVNEYCYAGMDFHGDPDLPLPADTQWGDIGMNSFCFLWYFFYFSHIYHVFGCASVLIMCVLLWSRRQTCAPRRETLTHAEGQSPGCCRVRTGASPGGEALGLTDLCHPDGRDRGHPSG
jgi:hypothetical protein